MLFSFLKSKLKLGTSHMSPLLRFFRVHTCCRLSLTSTSLLGRRHKVSHRGSNRVGSRVQGEMAAVNNVDLGVRNILAVTLRLARVKRCFVFAPDHEQPRLLLAHPFLPFRIGVDVGSVVVEKIALYLSLAGPI